MKQVKNTSGICAGIATACCFGLLNLILGMLGFTAAIAVVNNYGDYIFFPAYSFFSTIFVWALLREKKNWLRYTITAVAIALGVYFMLFGITYTLLVIGGTVLGGIATKWLKRK